MKTKFPNTGKKFVSIAEYLETKGRRKGLEEGIEEGIEKEKKKIALSMIIEGISDDIILKLTGISIEQLNFLKTAKDQEVNIY
ncbi:MAG: hypothetical protein JXR68_12205 [Bacteroidales bacterium]|nr:hypothetical protein [Bacteroidales bacterium]